MFNNLSIRLKLIVLLGASAAIALFISSLMTLFSTFISEKEESLRVLHQLAEVSSENLRAAVAFHDDASARRVLASMQANPNILIATVEDEQGRAFSHYASPALAPGEIERHRRRLGEAVAGQRDALFGRQAAIEQTSLGHMHVVTPIVFEGKPIGSLAIVSDNAALWHKILRHFGFQFLVSMATLAILVAISIRLQGLFTRPIFDLIDIMHTVSRTKDYSVSIPSRRSDEFNDLNMGFNAMLAEIRQRDEMLSRLAMTDALTGLHNRWHAMELLATMVARAHRKQEPLGVIMLDVDHFKRINDEFGHPVGDVVLKEIARIVSGSAREYDVVARVGGEEFLVLCDDSGPAATLATAERIRAGIGGHPIEFEDGRHLAVTASLGAYSVVPASQDVEGIIKIVDSALYRAKNSGRNRVESGMES
jgi:diguanylate cyclase (GGDEF)-like protein